MNWTGSTMRMAWRNLWRNRRRTALALAAIGLSVTLVLAYTSILRAYGEWIVETITGPMLGHVQAHAPHWRKDRLMERTLRDVDATLAELRRDPDVAWATARVYAPALAARGEEGFAVIVMGIDSRAESGPARLLTDVVEPLREREALIGRQLAELMDVRAGDEVAVVGQGVDGSLANDLFTVKGLVTTSVDLVNRQGILIELSDAQTLFAMPDEAHEIVIHARRPEHGGGAGAASCGREHVCRRRSARLADARPGDGDARAHHGSRRPARAPAGLHRCRRRCREHDGDGHLRADARVRDVARPGHTSEPPGEARHRRIDDARGGRCCDGVVDRHRAGHDYAPDRDRLQLAGGWRTQRAVLRRVAVFAPVLPSAQRSGCRPRDRRRLCDLAAGRDMARTPREPAAARAGAEGHVMGTAWTYAWRSLRRNARRTALSILGIGIGCALALFMESLNRGRDELFARMGAYGGAGHVRIVPDGWRERRDPRLRLANQQADAEAVRELSGVAAVTVQGAGTSVGRHGYARRPRRDRRRRPTHRAEHQPLRAQRRAKAAISSRRISAPSSSVKPSPIDWSLDSMTRSSQLPSARAEISRACC